MLNTNIAATVREVSQQVPVVASADNKDSVDILQLAGATHVFQFMKLLGEALARKTLGIRIQGQRHRGHRFAADLGNPGDGYSFGRQDAGRSRLREITGLNVIGFWEEGRYIAPHFRTPRSMPKRCSCWPDPNPN
jgi:voltage-gated potassium channel